MKLLAVAGAVSATQGPSSAVQKVIKLLDGLKQKVIEESAEAEKEQAAASDLCIKQKTELTAHIEFGSQRVEEASAISEKGGADAQAAAVEIAQYGQEIAKFQDEAKTSQTIRTEQQKEFIAAEKELADASNMLAKAYSVLKRSLTGHSFIQADGEEKVREVVSALSVVIDAAWIDPKGKKAIQEFLQADDGLSLHQPQAIVKNYESKSGGILDMIEKLQDKTSEELSKLRAANLSKQHEFELFMQNNKNQVQNKEDMLGEAKEQKSNAEAAQSGADADFAQYSDALAADKDNLAKTKTSCARGEDEFNARQKSAVEEVEVITKAVDVLSSKFSLLQVAKGKFEVREHASALLRKLGHKFNNFGLIQAATAAQDDPFVKVRGMVESMIKQLTEEAHAEATKEGQCKADIASGEKRVKVSQEQMNKYQSRLDGANAKDAKLAQQIEELNAALKDDATQMQAATKIRNNEKKTNAAVALDAKESVEAVSEAIKVLKEFYGMSFLQVSQPTKGAAANAIIEILETSQMDFLKIQEETEQGEKDAASAYEEALQRFKVSKAKREAVVAGAEKERAGLKVMKNQVTDDLNEVTKAFNAASEFLSSKRDECANKAMSYEERQRRREEEIQGLREALEILSADDEAAFIQTGFMATK